jgi:ureidoacrylate peracid hydrolase
MSEFESMLKRPTALIIVDVQNDFCHPQGSMAQRGVQLFPDLSLLLTQLQQLVTHARSQRWPIFFIQTEHSRWTDSKVWLQRMRLGVDVTELPVCAEGSWGAEFFHILPEPSDRVIVKHRYSAFMNTSLKSSLLALGIETVLVTGVVTNTCVESTARDAFMHDFWTLTVADCCAAPSQAEHDAALHNLGRYFGTVVHTHDILQAAKRSF